VKREPFPFPKLKIKRKVEKIEDFCIDDLEVVGYQSHAKVAMKMAV
jgi:thymidylate synthase